MNRRGSEVVVGPVGYVVLVDLVDLQLGHRGAELRQRGQQRSDERGMNDDNE